MMSPVRPMTDGSTLTRSYLVGDLIGLLVFLAIGLNRHGEDVVTRFAALAGIFAVAWLIVAWALGTYRQPTNGRLVFTLLVGIPLGVLVRAALVQAWTAREVATFCAVALVFATLFVGVARLLVSLLARGKAAP
jgi:hypothetical protein